jgi:FtsP/CotA-like multicopper oxidase with cupredoxin domain
VALDGNAVPNPAPVSALCIGTAERVSALVEMNHPGVWLLGDLDDEDRPHGMGIVVEYAGAAGGPKWLKPRSATWDYTLFGEGTAPEPDETIDMVFEKRNAAFKGFNQWTINGTAFSMDRMTPMFHVRKGHRYRLRMRNASDDIHPVHLHRHSFELTRIAGKPTAGVIKDVVMLAVTRNRNLISSPIIPEAHCFTAISSCTWILASWLCLTMCELPARGPSGPLPWAIPLER